jgi:hypothetical protein
MTSGVRRVAASTGSTSRSVQQTLLAATAALAVAMIPSIALANYYSVGETTTSGSWGGGYAQAQIENMTAPDCATGGHTNQTLWAGTDNGAGWAETGWTRGFEGNCGLFYYWAYYNPAKGYHEYKLSTATTGGYHNFEVQEVFVGEYDVYRDGTKYGSVVGAQPWTTWAEAGLEQTAASGTSVTQTAWDWHEVRTTACCTWNWWPNGSIYNDSGHRYVWTATNPWIHALVKPS